MRILLRVAIGLGLLAALAVGLAWIFQGSVVKAAIQAGGTWATGVDTRVEDVSAALFGGTLELENLTVANPAGFSAEPFFALRTTKADWDSKSLLGDTVHVRELELDGLALRIERTASGTNYGRVLEHIGQKGGPSKSSAEPSADSKRVLVVDRIVLKDISAELVLADLAVASGPLRVTVPRLEILDFRSDGPTHEIVGQLLAAVVEAALKASLDAGAGVFPADLARDLKSKLGDAEAAWKGVLDGDLKGSIEGAGKAVEGLKDLFGGQKKP